MVNIDYIDAPSKQTQSQACRALAEQVQVAQGPLESSKSQNSVVGASSCTSQLLRFSTGNYFIIHGFHVIYNTHFLNNIHHSVIAITIHRAFTLKSHRTTNGLLQEGSYHNAFLKIKYEVS